MQRRKPHFDTFDDVLKDAHMLMNNGYTRLGNWSLGQAASHLATLVEMACNGFPWYLPWPLTALARWYALGRMLRRETFPAGLRGPKFALPPDQVEDHAGVERLSRAFAAFDQAQSLYPSPLFGRLSQEQWRQVHLWHAEHHFSFLLPQGEQNPGDVPSAQSLRDVAPAPPH